MISVEGQVPYLQFENFDKHANLLNFVSTRKGGVSLPPRDSLNLSFDNRDEPINVIENRVRLCRSIGVGLNNCVIAEQTHSANIRVVHRSDLGQGIFLHSSELKDIDGLVTIDTNICLCVVTADCLPIIFFEPDQKIASILHAGWRGLHKGIIKNACNELTKLGGDVAKVKVGIGPYIDAENYEVSKDVYELFDSVPDALLPKSPDKMFLDIGIVAIQQLIAMGVEPNNVEISGLSTFKNNDLFFSYRRSKPNGAMMTGVMLK